MSNGKTEIEGIGYKNFKSNLKHPKLTWIIDMLNRYGVGHNLVHTIKGPMLQVQQGAIELASSILHQELGEFLAVTENDDEAVPMKIVVTIDDLPNDHPFFEAQLAGRKIVPMREVSVDVAETVALTKPTMDPVRIKQIQDEAVEAEAALADDVLDRDSAMLAALAAVKEDDPSIEDDWADEPETDEDDDWDFDEDDEDVEDAVAQETEDPMVIEVQATVRDAEPEPAATDTTQQVVYPDGAEFNNADMILAHEDVKFPETKQPIRMYDVESSNMSRVGFRPSSKDPLVGTLYIGFKGGTLYRYNPVDTAHFNQILNEAIRRQNGIQEASAGSFFHWAVKDKAEAGTIKCQRLNETSWVDVLPKSERTKAIKSKVSGKELKAVERDTTK